MKRNETVFVGLSGGVDSSVSALMLKNNGYNVVGVFIKVWQPDFLICDWERERLDAMRVASHLDIPFLTFDATEVYKREVADYMIEEYRAGRTPNPDVMCNTHVKFDAFLQFALNAGADKVATGHYAQITKRNSEFFLMRGVDTQKDQSYFLWTLTENELQHLIFPIGHLTKTEVRKIARSANLPTSTKLDSQGICFLGQIDMKEFLSHYITQKPGTVLDEVGNVIGSHSGALFYTLGERHGFMLYSHETRRAPHYVVAKNLDTNTITVSPNQKTLLKHDELTLEHSSLRILNDENNLTAQFRYRQKPFEVIITENSDSCVKLRTTNTTPEFPSVGQSCVVYDNAVCLGGGIVT